jgi:glycosyltransferase involved in cell wall biosynthesis
MLAQAVTSWIVMTTPLALFNGSYLGSRPTGIGVVARDLHAFLNPQKVRAIWPQGLSPDHGSKGHWRRLVWTQTKLPGMWRASGASLLLSPLPEAPIGQGVPSVVLAHDLLPLRFPQLSPLLAYHLAYVPLVLYGARHVLCNSEATAREVHGRLGLPLKRLSVLRLGFSPGLLKPLDLERQPFLLVLGRHDPHKNLVRLIKAFAQLPHGPQILHFVGPHDPRYTPKLVQLASELGITARCRFTPWVSDSDRLKLLNLATALVIPSLWEGFGLPALEAMACATPVLASSAGALPEVVGAAALQINPQSISEMTSAMAQILNDHLLQIELARAGPAQAAQFNWAQTGVELEQRLEALAA